MRRCCRPPHRLQPHRRSVPTPPRPDARSSPPSRRDSSRIPNLRTRSAWSPSRSSSIVHKLQGQLIIELPEEGDDFLQIVLALAPDADLLVLILRVHLELGRFDRIDQRLALLLGDPGAKDDSPAHRSLRSRFDLAVLERLYRDAALDGTALNDIDDVLQLELVVGDDDDLFAGLFDRGLRVFEVEAARDLFACLIERILELLLVDTRDHIERRIPGHSTPR